MNDFYERYKEDLKSQQSLRLLNYINFEQEKKGDQMMEGDEKLNLKNDYIKGLEINISENSPHEITGRWYYESGLECTVNFNLSIICVLIIFGNLIFI